MGGSRSHSRSRRRNHQRYRSSDRSHKSTRRRTRYSRSSSKSSESSSNDKRTNSSNTSSSRSVSRSPVRNIKSNSSNAPATAAANKIKLQKTPSPPPAPSFSMNYLDERQVTDALDELNADEFVPKTFKSDASTKIKTETANAGNIVKNYSGTPNEDPLFHQNVIIIVKHIDNSSIFIENVYTLFFSFTSMKTKEWKDGLKNYIIIDKNNLPA